MTHIEELRQKYPELLQNAFDISHPPGWAQIVDDLCAELTTLIGFLPHSHDDFYVQQIKQKFGGLRFYMACETGAMTKAIQAAEDACGNVCEMCGAPGKSTTFKGWVATMCQTHTDEWAGRK